ncbi:MAG: hypothetical protein ACREVJ_16195, partial [Gammaproteobacteria bacterium]
SQYHRAPVPGALYFFALNTYRRQAPLAHAEVLAALRSPGSASNRWSGSALVQAQGGYSEFGE